MAEPRGYHEPPSVLMPCVKLFGGHGAGRGQHQSQCQYQSDQCQSFIDDPPDCFWFSNTLYPFTGFRGDTSFTPWLKERRK